MEVVIAVELGIIAAVLAMAVYDLRRMCAPPTISEPRSSRLSESVKKAVIKAAKQGAIDNSIGNVVNVPQMTPIQWKASTNPDELRIRAEERFREMQEAERASRQ